jgi:hypothetical protein
MFFRSRFSFALVVFTGAALLAVKAAVGQSNLSFNVPQAEVPKQPARALQDPLPLGDPRKLSLLDEAYLDAFGILSRNNECSRWFGGPPATEVLNEFRQRIKQAYFNRQIAFEMKGEYMLVTSARTRISYRIFPRNEINVEGAFYRGNSFRTEPRAKPIGWFMPSTREARLLILLHELGHLIKSDDGQWLLRDDGHNPYLSDKNTGRVLASCGAEIRKAVRISAVHEWEMVGKGLQ